MNMYGCIHDMYDLFLCYAMSYFLDDMDTLVLALILCMDIFIMYDSI